MGGSAFEMRLGEPGLEAGGRTLLRRALEMTSRNSEANWNPGTKDH